MASAVPRRTRRIFHSNTVAGVHAAIRGELMFPRPGSNLRTKVSSVLSAPRNFFRGRV